MNLLTPLMMSIAFFLPLSADAGGTYVGNGGHVIACFLEEPTPDFFEFGSFSFLGHEKLTLIEALDFYVAKRLLRGVPSYMANSIDIDDLQNLKTVDLRNKIHERLLKIGPPLSEQFSCVINKTGEFRKGIRAEMGLIDIKDQNLPFSIPKKCTILQAIIRQGAIYYFNPVLILDLNIRTKSKVSQEGILQLHEDFYAFAAEVFGHTDSARARNLLAHLLTTELTPAEIKSHLSFFGEPKKNACE